MYPTYIYLGDRLTAQPYKGSRCVAVRRPDGKCIRGRNGSMLVDFGYGPVVVIGRLLRKAPPAPTIDSAGNIPLTGFTTIIF